MVEDQKDRVSVSHPCCRQWDKEQEFHQDKGRDLPLWDREQGLLLNEKGQDLQPWDRGQDLLLASIDHSTVGTCITVGQ